jgi:putative hydrolase of the HAD superfamily
MTEEMCFSPEEVPALRHRLWRQYGTTLRGLQVEYAVEMDAFLDYVHDIRLETLLKPNQKLGQVLRQLPQRKIIFTNANATHAQRVLETLDIAAHFEKIVDIYAMQPFCKPHIEAFQTALSLIREQPEACLLVDDSPKNLETAKSLGMAAVAVGPHSAGHTPHIDSILDLPEVFFS